MSTESSSQIVSGFPVCSYEHPPINMRLVSWFASGDDTQDETWTCSTCEGQFRCDGPAREIPEALRS